MTSEPVPMEPCADKRKWRGIFGTVLGMLLAISIAPVQAQEPTPPGRAASPPTFASVKGQPVRIEDLDRALRAGIQATPASAAVQPVAATRVAALTTMEAGLPVVSAACAASSQPTEIIALAASLKCDPDLIFEYVYNNIEYEPLFGSNKGALGTLLDQRGNDIDQAQLLVALLNAAGFSSSQMSFQYGYIRLNGTTASGWLGVKNDGQAICNVFANGGVPIGNCTIYGDGTLAFLDVAHVWVRVQIGGSNYVFSPSFKQYAVSTGLSNLSAALGYSRSQFLSGAGGTIDSVSISNLNRSNVRKDLVTYASNLARYIKDTNPGWTLGDVVGGKVIQYLSGSPLRQTSLPNLSPSQPSGFPQVWGATVPNAYRTCFTISMPGVAQTLCGAASSQTIELYADATYGRRITVFSVPSGSNNVPTLLIDGAPPPNGQNTGTALSTGSWTVNVAIKHPYTGPLAAAANQAQGLVVGVGGSYLIGAGWGQVGRAMIEMHRRRLANALSSGASPNSEAVLGESLAVINLNWLAEFAAVQRLGDSTSKVTTQYHHGLGITGQTAIQASGSQGPYVDLPLNFSTLQSQTSQSGGGFSPSEIGAFYTSSGISSSLESAVLEQTQALVPGMQAASTVRLVDMNVATAAKTYLADGTTSAGVTAYFSAIRGNISASYSAADLNFIDYSVSSNGTPTGIPTGKQVLLPANGAIGVGLWNGAGYTVSNQQSTSISVLQKISGGLSGGFSGNNVPTPTVVTSTQSQMPAASGSATIPAGALATAPAPQSPTIAEPIDAIGGAYIYNHSDITTGGGGFPDGLPFARTYTSSSNRNDVGLGNGWAHNYNIRVSRSSNPYVGLGEGPTISAAAAIAAIYISQDLLSGTKTAQRMTVAWVVSRWLTDQLTNNSVLVAWPGTNEEFTLLPRLDGSASALYNPPFGSAVVLTGLAPDSYGNFTTFTYRNKDQSQLVFNPIDATPNASNGQIASWSWPNGMGLNFTYGYSVNSAAYLSSVTNNLGRSLTLAYSGAHLASVVDDTSRSATYTYDSNNNNLASVADPMGYATTFAYDGAASHLTQVFYPTNPASPFVTNIYDGLGRVSQQSDANNNTWTFYFGGSRTETIDAASNRHITYQTPRGKVIKDAAVLSSSYGNVFNDTAQQNNVVNVASNQFDGQDRLVLATAPEGGTVGYTYSLGLLHNLIQVTQTPKPGSPLAARTTTTSYDPFYNKPTRITDPLGLVTQFSYAPATGNLLTVVADAGSAPHFNARTSFDYTGQGQLLSSTDALGVMTLNAYDERGNLTSTTRDAGPASHLNQRTALRYNPQGDVIAVTDPNGNTSTSRYDANRRLVSVTAPATTSARQGLVTGFSLDPDGRVIQTQQSANGTVLNITRTRYSYTGQPVQSIDAKGNITVYTYDSLDRLASTTDAMGRKTVFSYDALGRRTGVYNPAIQGAALLQQSYTADGLLASLSDANNNVTAFAYDGFDRLASTTYPNSSTETQSFDANGNVLSRKTRNNVTVAYSYDSLNRLASKTPPSSPVVTYAYDLGGRITGISDTSSAMAAAVPSTGTTVQYASSTSYDPLNRPLNTVWTPAATFTAPANSSATFTHGYNSTNQRTSHNTTDNTWFNTPATASSTSYTANNLNQYSAIGAVTPTYDGNGNLSFDGSFTYGYDVENRLVLASGAGNTVTYAYDAQGRRKRKTVNGISTIYVTDADNREVLEYSGASGAVQSWYAYGQGSNEVLNRMDVTNNSRQTLIPDIQGSFIGTLDSNGTLTKRGYKPFGESSTTTGSMAYTGQRIDPETNGLYYYRARMYSPGLGRFLQADPIGYAAGANLYAYVGNDPVNAVDPSGLIDWLGVASSLVGLGVNSASILTGGTLIGGGSAVAAVPTGVNQLVGLGSIALGSVLVGKGSTGAVLSLNNLVDAWNDRPASLPSSLPRLIAEGYAPGNRGALAAADIIDIATSVGALRAPVGGAYNSAGNFVRESLTQSRNMQTANRAISNQPYLEVGAAGTSNASAIAQAGAAAGIGLKAYQWGTDSACTSCKGK